MVYDRLWQFFHPVKKKPVKNAVFLVSSLPLLNMNPDSLHLIDAVKMSNALSKKLSPHKLNILLSYVACKSRAGIHKTDEAQVEPKFNFTAVYTKFELILSQLDIDPFREYGPRMEQCELGIRC